MKKSSSSDTVLITGASKGIGRELARQFAAAGHPLVTVAHSREELESAADELRTAHGADVHCVATDLADARGVDALWEELSRRRLDIGTLCNNAGLGQRGRFWEIPVERDLEMIRTNIEAVIRLTKRLLPPMLERGRGRILNTASIAGFEPGPLLAVYHATKAFVLSWSEALATELEDTGVTVTALCPGPVDTDFFPKADMLDTKVFQRGNVMGPIEVAEAAFAAVLRGDRVIVPGAINKAMVASRRIMPVKTQAKLNQKYYETADSRSRARGDIERKELRQRSRSRPPTTRTAQRATPTRRAR